MMAAQLIASHNAAMEYRRAMIDEQTFEGRRETLNQANKLSRTSAVLLDALNRHRGRIATPYSRQKGRIWQNSRVRLPTIS